MPWQDGSGLGVGPQASWDDHRPNLAKDGEEELWALNLVFLKMPDLPPTSLILSHSPLVLYIKTRWPSFTSSSACVLTPELLHMLVHLRRRPSSPPWHWAELMSVHPLVCYVLLGALDFSFAAQIHTQFLPSQLCWDLYEHRPEFVHEPVHFTPFSILSLMKQVGAYSIHYTEPNLH